MVHKGLRHPQRPDNEERTSVTHETTTTGPGTCIPLASLPNLRDIGGYTTSSGATVRTGVLYRPSPSTHSRTRMPQNCRSAASAPCSICGPGQNVTQRRTVCPRARPVSSATSSRAR
ncbi:tyrosine-protein phosphatase [Brevibacterium sp.]|uniref:tyrosine-protein phosphatase n=1 Tax=Brevibacterium TaxID=1696 RepID=UPI00341C9862